MAENNPLGSIQSAVAAALRREVSVYDVPAKVGMGGLFASLGFVALTMTEEYRASARAVQGVEGTDQQRFTMELVKESLRQVNGAPVGLADGSVEVALGKMSPQVRALCLMAYNDCNGVAKEDSDGFLKSRSDSVGG